MGRAEIFPRRGTGALDRPDPQPNVAAYIKGTLELQLPVEVAVIAELMSVVRDPAHDLRPAFGVTAEDEEGCPHSFLGQRVENSRSGIRIRPVVEGERDDLAGALDLSECGSE